MKNSVRIFTWLLAILTLPVTAFAKETRPNMSSAAHIAETIRFEFAVYYLPLPSKDPVQTVKLQLPDLPNAPAVVEQQPKSPSSPSVKLHLEKDVKANYSAPSVRALSYSARGLTAEQGKSLQNSRQVLILDFAHPKKYVWSALLAANALVERTARQTNGLIWDAETREIFTPDEWHKRRIGTWNGGVPDVTWQTIIHSYQNNDFVRAITLGMAKVGLPDVVVDDFPWSSDHQVGNLINDFCQMMAEGAVINANGEFDLDLKKIRDPVLRKKQLDSLVNKATGIGLLAIEPGKLEEGDSDNRLLRITAKRYAGPDAHARQENMLSSLFGSTDSISRIKHNDELLAASKRARTKLPALQRAFEKGLLPGEFILLKAPFKTPTGANEWMWVEVASWKKSLIVGLLQNDPFDIPELHTGQKVEVKEEDVFDYIHHLPDGSSEGNDTWAIIEKMEAAAKK
jgi:uncharacterized protein YegJ (DUF2314 family)